MDSPRPGKIAVIGLGYVGLPLAVALAKHFNVIGLDIDQARVDELRAHVDRTGEVESETLAGSTLALSTEPSDCGGAEIFIVTVPTPVDAENRPDLAAVEGASRAVGRLLEAGRSQIVVYESTVYPGVTEEVCGPILSHVSGLECGRDFFLGYSPERINPGDREHSVERIVKVVAGQTHAVTERLAEIYGAVTRGGVFRAASIKAAEAAKVIENAQRDINIAFMNEVTQIFSKLGLSIWDVLEAARTKWNFLPFQPGLVGGHCIGVDPYYLSHRAQQLGHDPDVILAGRATNDGMATWLADRIHEERAGRTGSALVLGLTFKENVPDLRNSKVVDLISRLEELGHSVRVHDPLADPGDALHEYGISLLSDLNEPADLLIAAVPHANYCALGSAGIAALVKPGGCVADLKGIWRGLELPSGVSRWSM